MQAPAQQRVQGRQLARQVGPMQGPDQQRGRASCRVAPQHVQT
jgi:hypothetical protein